MFIPTNECKTIHFLFPSALKICNFLSQIASKYSFLVFKLDKMFPRQVLCKISNTHSPEKVESW